MLWKLSSQFKSEYQKTLVSQNRGYPIRGLHASESISLDLERIYVNPTVIPVNPIAGSNHHLSIWDFLALIDQQPGYRRLVVLGGFGAGKTLLLKYLTLIYAQNYQQKFAAKSPKLIPILLFLPSLKKLIANNSRISLAEVITLVIQRELKLKIEPSSQWFKEKLDQGKCLVMVDDLDKIFNPKERRLLRDWLDIQMEFYPNTNFIITTRPQNYFNEPLEQASLCLELQPYKIHQMEQFLHQFYLHQEELNPDSKSNYQEIVNYQSQTLLKILKSFEQLAPLASNPFMLTLIAFYHSKQHLTIKKRRLLYQEICSYLLFKHPRSQPLLTNPLATPQEVQQLLQIIALQLMEKEQIEFTKAEGQEIIQQTLTKVLGKDGSSDAFLEYIISTSNLLVETSPQTYQFVYLNFQEYLAVVEIEAANQEQTLIDHIDDPWWSEAVRLYGAKNDTSKIILAAWNKRTVLTMTLAYDCWEEGQDIHPQLRERLENWLEAALESSDYEIARLAARVQLSRRLNHALVTD